LLSEDEKRATEVLAVSVDAKPELQRMVDRVGKEYGKVPEFPLLSDPGHRVIDRQGVGRWRFVEVNYKVRATNEMVLEALRAVK
jgi:peroxiredoxin